MGNGSRTRRGGRGAQRTSIAEGHPVIDRLSPRAASRKAAETALPLMALMRSMVLSDFNDIFLLRQKTVLDILDVVGLLGLIIAAELLRRRRGIVVDHQCPLDQVL